MDQINEPIYPELKFPNDEYRLLGLFRYWNIIEYFYPYKYLTDQSWDSVLLEMIPKMRSVSNKDDYQLLLLELVAKLDDSHAWIRTSDEKSKFLPFRVSRIEGKPVVSEILNDSLAQIIDVKLGDVVMKMNGYDFQNLVVENLKFQAGSNKNIKLRYVYNYILNKANDSVQVTVERNGQLVEVNSQYYDYQEIKTQNNLASLGYKLLSESVGYMDLQFIKSGKQVIEIFKSLKNEKAIIIDLRTYPALIHLVMSKFLNSEKRTFALTFSPSIDYPSRFEYNLELNTMSSKKAFSGKVFLLVNEKSLSKAEFVAMSLQTADNIITIGSQTAGADGTVVIVDYLGGYKTAFTGNGVMYPDGTETQRTGVKVDIEVNPTINGLRAGRDEVLEKTLQLASEL